MAPVVYQLRSIISYVKWANEHLRHYTSIQNSDQEMAASELSHLDFSLSQACEHTMRLVELLAEQSEEVRNGLDIIGYLPPK